MRLFCLSSIACKQEKAIVEKEAECIVYFSR